MVGEQWKRCVFLKLAQGGIEIFYSSFCETFPVVSLQKMFKKATLFNMYIIVRLSKTY